MSDIADDDASDRPQHGDETTINEAGTPGFAVDGTDSFAVPGPGDGVPPLDAPVAGAPWRRLLVTLGAAVIVLALVVVIGTSGRDRSDAGSMRGAETTVPDYTLPSPFGGEGDETATTAGDSFDETYSTLATYDPYGPDVTYSVDTIQPGSDDPYGSPPLEIPTYRPYVPPSRNVPSVTRPRVTIPARRPATTTTPPAATTTTVATTTATTTAPPTTAAPTTTSPPPPPAWTAVAASGLPSSCVEARTWVGSTAMYLRVGGSVFRSTDGQAWTSVASGGVRDVTEPGPDGRFWVGSSEGVFDQAGAPLGMLADVTSLSARVEGATTSMLAVASPASTLYRFDNGTWTAVDDQDLVGATPDFVRFLDNGHALLGTDAGVFGSDDGGATWTPGSLSAGQATFGLPAVDGTRVAWLVASGTGVIISDDNGASWPTRLGTPTLAGLAALPGGRLAAIDDGAVVTLAGTTWSPIEPAPTGAQSSIVHSAAAKATFAISDTCAVQRLPDS